jgi:hypothetical protein
MHRLVFVTMSRRKVPELDTPFTSVEWYAVSFSLFGQAAWLLFPLSNRPCRPIIAQEDQDTILELLCTQVYSPSPPCRQLLHALLHLRPRPLTTATFV